MTVKTDDKKAEEKDFVPDLPDDAPEPEAAARDSDPVSSDERKVSAETEKPESPREAAVRRYRELRAEQERAERDGEAASADDSADDEPEPDPVKDQGTTDRTASNADDEPEIELKVHGETKRLKKSEVIAKAQIALASENILDEVKGLREELKSALAQRRSIDGQADQPDDDDRNAQPDRDAAVKSSKADQPDDDIDAEKLESIVQRIQVGDTEEGRQALIDFLKMSRSGKGDGAENVGRVVREEMAKSQLVDEVTSATAEFKEKYSGIISDPDLLNIALVSLTREITNDLVKSGVDEKSIRNANLDQLMDLHQRARMAGAPAPRRYKDILDTVGTSVSTKFAPVLQTRQAPANQDRSQPQQRSNADVIAGRVDRKRAATPQPRTAGARMPTEPQKSRKTPQQIVQEARQARGFRN